MLVMFLVEKLDGLWGCGLWEGWAEMDGRFTLIEVVFV